MLGIIDTYMHAHTCTCTRVRTHTYANACNNFLPVAKMEHNLLFLHHNRKSQDDIKVFI